MLYDFFGDRQFGNDMGYAIKRLLIMACEDAKAEGKDYVIPHVWLAQKTEAAKEAWLSLLCIAVFALQRAAKIQYSSQSLFS